MKDWVSTTRRREHARSRRDTTDVTRYLETGIELSCGKQHKDFRESDSDLKIPIFFAQGAYSGV